MSVSQRPTVCILMSTYNGERYIREQMDSLLSQADVIVKIVVRDDGSKDSTCRIIEEEYPMVELYKEENIGCEPSFMKLLHSAPIAEYYAFCDQDDVWMKDKLSSAINQLSIAKGPAIYGCNLNACDKDLNFIKTIHTSETIARLRNKAGKDFVFNMHGCVLVWNRDLQMHIESYYPEYIPPHDTWVNSIGNALGTMFIDDTPHILYRLHGNNTGGLAQTKIERLKKGFRRYFGKYHPQRDKLAAEILKGYASFIKDKNEGYQELVCLESYKNTLKNKIRLMGYHIIKDYQVPDRYFWMLCILFNKF